LFEISNFCVSKWIKQAMLIALFGDYDVRCIHWEFRGLQCIAFIGELNYMKLCYQLIDKTLEIENSHVVLLTPNGI